MDDRIDARQAYLYYVIPTYSLHAPELVILSPAETSSGKSASSFMCKNHVVYRENPTS
jgi:hypothetical protein